MESGKYEGDDRKKYKTESKGSGLLPASKLNENNPKPNRKKTKEISNEFPNFTALTEEERLAFFEILNAARKNVEETKESSTSECFNNTQDEFMEYFNGMFLQGGERKKISSEPNPTYSSTYAAEENAREETLKNSALDLPENFDPDDLFLLDKTFKCDSTSLTSLSPCQSVKEKEISPKLAEKASLSKKNSSCTEIETWDEDQTNLDIDQHKVVNFYLKNKKLTEKKKKDSNKKTVKSSPLIESALDDDAWSGKTYELPLKNLESEKVTDKKKKCEQSIKTDTGLSIKATPKFDSLSAEEKRIFFSVLQEAHENVLEKNSQNESGVLPFESIIKSYRMESSQNYSYETAIDSQTLRFQRDDRANIKVKVTLTSGDNQRMEKETEEERYSKLKPSKVVGSEDSKKIQEASKTEKETNDTSSLESCEEEADKPELMNKEEMSKLYNSKKKVIESSAKSTIQGPEEQKKLKGEDCDENLKNVKLEIKDTKPPETSSSEPKKTDEKNVENKTVDAEKKTVDVEKKTVDVEKKTVDEEKKPVDVKDTPISEWSGEPEKPPPKKSEKKFFGFSRSKKEDKNKTYQFKNIGNEGQSSEIKPKAQSKSVSKKDKNVPQVESFGVFEIKQKPKSDDKVENDAAQKSLKTSKENLLEADKLQQKVSVYRNETTEGGQIFEIKDTVSVKEESHTEVKPVVSTTNENGHQNEEDNISLDPNTLVEKNQVEEPVELEVFSSKIVVSREDQHSIKAGQHLVRSTHENHLHHSNKSVTKSHEKNFEQSDADKKMKPPSFKCGKVVLVDDGVIEKIKQLIQDLEVNAKAEEDSLSNDYVQLLLEYISYLSRVLCSLVNRREKNLNSGVVHVQTSLTSPNPQVKLEKRKCKPKDKTKGAEAEAYHGVRSASVSNIQDSPHEKKKLEKKKSSVTSTASEAKSEDEDGLWAPMFVKEKILPSTKIRLLQDLLKERAKFVEGSISEFKVVRLPEKDYVPPEKPILRLNLEDEEEAFVEKGQKFNFFKALVKFCRCGRKETSDENSILENLKGEAVAVDTSEGQAKNPASATINDSTMEVLKAAERKKIIQKYWKYN